MPKKRDKQIQFFRNSGAPTFNRFLVAVTLEYDQTLMSIAGRNCHYLYSKPALHYLKSLGGNKMVVIHRVIE